MKINLHHSVTLSRLLGLASDREHTTDNPGVCIACGADHDSSEPDACQLECYECDAFKVYGAEALLERHWFFTTAQPAQTVAHHEKGEVA